MEVQYAEPQNHHPQWKKSAEKNTRYMDLLIENAHKGQRLETVSGGEVAWGCGRKRQWLVIDNSSLGWWKYHRIRLWWWDWMTRNILEFIFNPLELYGMQITLQQSWYKKRVREGKKKSPVSVKVYVTMVGGGEENDAFSVFIAQMMASVFFPAPVHLRWAERGLPGRAQRRRKHELTPGQAAWVQWGRPPTGSVISQQVTRRLSPSFGFPHQ